MLSREFTSYSFFHFCCREYLPAFSALSIMKATSVLSAALAIGCAAAYPSDLSHPEVTKLGKRQAGMGAMVNKIFNSTLALLHACCFFLWQNFF